MCFQDPAVWGACDPPPPNTTDLVFLIVYHQLPSVSADAAWSPIYVQVCRDITSLTFNIYMRHNIHSPAQDSSLVHVNAVIRNNLAHVLTGSYDNVHVLTCTLTISFSTYP